MSSWRLGRTALADPSASNEDRKPARDLAAFALSTASFQAIGRALAYPRGFPPSREAGAQHPKYCAILLLNQS